MFRTRLDYLMHLTNTGNTALGTATVFAPSYISRIRMGKRPLPHNSTFLDSASAFLASRITQKEQREELCRAMDLPFYPSDASVCTGLIRAWLCEEDVRAFLGISAPAASLQPKASVSSADAALTHIYYGNAGKREAVLRLAESVSRSKKKQRLYSFRDTPTMDWMTEAPGYENDWKAALDAIEQSGSKYTIAVDHYVDLNTSNLGMDLYLPYMARDVLDIVFYPKQRDNLFHLYFFVASETAAIVYAGTTSQKETSPYIYTEEAPAVHQYTEEIERLIRQCIGCMHTCTPGVHSDFWRYALTLDQFSDTVIRNYWNGPSALTLPAGAARSFSKRCNVPFSPMFYRFENRMKAHLEHYEIRDYICLPDANTVQNGAHPFSGGDLLGIPNLCYTAEEFKMHIRHLIALLNTYENYHLCLLQNASFPCDTYLMDNGKMVTISNTSPHIVRIDTLGYTSYAAASYLQEQTHTCRELPREETIAALKTYL